MTLPTVNTVDSPQAEGFGAQLDDLLLRLYVGPQTALQVETAPMQANRVQTSVDREEFVSDFGEVFARSDFTGGEGLDWAHRPNQGPNDPQRFWDSNGVHVERREPGRRRRLGLLPATKRILEDGDARYIVAVGDTLYAGGWGETIRRCATPYHDTPVWTTEDATAGAGTGNLEGLAVLGSEVFAALRDNGVHRRDASGTWAHYNDLRADGIWAAKGRLFVSSLPSLVIGTPESLYEVTASGAAPSTPLRTLAYPFTWTDVVDAGAYVLAGATDGYLYAWSVDETGDLTLVSQSLFEHEQIRSVAAVQGQVFVGTLQNSSGGGTGRLWRGSIDERGQFNGEVVREWSGGWPERIASDRETVYTVVPGGPPQGNLFAADGGSGAPTVTQTSLWRYDLTQGALFRHHTYAPVNTGTGIAVTRGAVYTVLEEDGVYRPSDQPVASGYLIGPLGDFYSADVKLWVGATLDVGDIPAGTRVELWFTTNPAGLLDSEHSSWVRVARVDSATGAGSEVPIANVEGRVLAGMVRLYADADRTAEPVVFGFGFRAYPSTPDVVVTLPVNVSDQVEMPGRAALRVPGRGAQVYQALRAREGRQALLRVYRPDETVRGVVESVGVPVVALTKRGSVTHLALVRVRGRRASLSGASTEGSFGTFLFGAAMFGGAE
jgi:hypothetical protein